MKVELLRGKEHIGGNIIKVTEGETAILLDCGAMLPTIGEAKVEDDFDMDRIGKVDALFLSHHHGDHSGLMDKLPAEVDLYTTVETVTFMDKLDMYMNRPLRTRGRAVHSLFDGESVTVGSLTVTLYITEHSADGSAMFRVEGGGKTLLYTGDFKHSLSILHGVDLLITEGTMLTRDGQAYADEDGVEMAFRRVFRETEGRVFVLTSSANLPRIRSVISARNHDCPDEIRYANYSYSSGDAPRPIMQDVFLKYILENTGHKELAAPYAFIWNQFSDSRSRAYDRIARHYCDTNAAASCRRINDLSRAVVFIRPTMVDVLEKLVNEGMELNEDALVFSMWRGYEKDPNVVRLLALFEKSGVQPKYIHTSGHADIQHIQELIHKVNPQKIACIHSENAGMIKELAGDIPVETGEVIAL